MTEKNQMVSESSVDMNKQLLEVNKELQIASAQQRKEAGQKKASGWMMVTASMIQTVDSSSEQCEAVIILEDGAVDSDQQARHTLNTRGGRGTRSSCS